MKKIALVHAVMNGVAVAVKSGERYLVCERVKCRDMNGYWQFPGGAVEIGESTAEAAQRELFEESGIVVPYSCLEHRQIVVWECDSGLIGITTVFYIDVGYEIVARNREPEKHGSWAWLSIDELNLKKLLIPCQHYIDSIAQMNNTIEDEEL